MQNRIFYILLISILVGYIEVDMSLPSLPDISNYFGIPDSLTQMTIGINFFGFCISSIVVGTLSDIYGRRQVMLIGNSIMLLGAGLCVFANSIEMLLIARFIQGFGASTSAVVVFVIISDLYSGKAAARAIGTFTALGTISMSGAPILGAFVNSLIGWRGSFIVVFVVNLLAVFTIKFFLPETNKSFLNAEKISGDTDNKFSPFLFNSMKLLRDYRNLLSSYEFVIAALIPSLLFASYMSFIACGAFLYMETYELPMIQYALHQSVVIIAFSVVSEFSSKVTTKLGEKRTIIAGLSLLLLSSLLLTIISYFRHDSPYITTSVNTLAAFGSALVYPIIFSKSFDIFPQIKGTASSAMMSIRMLAASIIISIISYIYSGELFTVALVIFTANLISVALTIYIFDTLLMTTDDEVV